MFKETKNHPDGYFTNTVESRGGKINAGTSRDWTYYYIQIPKEELELVVSLEADRMHNVVLSDEQINTEREVVKEERLYQVDNKINGRMNEKLHMTAYTKHSYSWPIIGHLEDLNAISRQTCLDFYHSYYAPNNATIVVVGDVNTKEVLSLIQKHYGDYQKAGIPSELPPTEPEQKEERRAAVYDKSLPAEKLLIAFHGPSVDNDERVTLEVINSILVDGKSSRLYRRLVDETKIAATVNGYVDAGIDPGLYRISVSLNHGHSANEAEKIVYEEIEKIKTELIDKRELEKTKNIVEAYSVRSLKTNQYRAFFLGLFHTAVGDYKELFNETEKFQAIEAPLVQEVANKYLTVSNRTVIIAKSEK